LSKDMPYSRGKYWRGGFKRGARGYAKRSWGGSYSKRARGSTSKDVTFKSHGAAQQNRPLRGDYQCFEVMRTGTLTVPVGAGSAVLAAQTTDSNEFQQYCNQYQMVKVTDYSVTILSANTSGDNPQKLDGFFTVMAPFRGTPNQMVGSDINQINTLSGAKCKIVTDTTPLTVMCKYPVCQIPAQGAVENTIGLNGVLRNEWTSLPRTQENNTSQVPNYCGIAVNFNKIGAVVLYQEKYKLHFKGRYLGNAVTPPAVQDTAAVAVKENKMMFARQLTIIKDMVEVGDMDEETADKQIKALHESNNEVQRLIKNYKARYGVCKVTPTAED